MWVKGNVSADCIDNDERWQETTKKQLSLKTIFMPNNALRAYLDEKKIFRDLDIDSLFD